VTCFASSKIMNFGSCIILINYYIYVSKSKFYSFQGVGNRNSIITKIITIIMIILIITNNICTGQSGEINLFY